jgi:hypothetical protein
MLTHVVLFKFKSRDPQVVAEARDKLRALPAQIDLIKGYEVGVNIIASARAYDLALVSRFETVETLRAYQEHPAHVPVSVWMNEQCESIVAADYQD